ncbi:hypothetical protein ANO11243_041270 [Dothideomycetidae sp. 11243]|nr:hypothetical protein ANO11243_041270 [fungal sp. No.11243]
MDHFAPHPGAQFEGYYSKFDLPSGARLALIITTVPKAKHRPHVVSFTYVPKGTNEYFQREISVDSVQMVKTSDDKAFELRADGMGSVAVGADSVTTYSIKHADFSFSARTTTRQPWSTTAETPESALVHLPLPLHWHVHSLASDCTFELDIPDCAFLANEDRSGIATVHQEKNWANSFPSAHIWVQARKGIPPSKSSSKNPSPYQSICIAGGQILGTEAYLLGYRSTTHPSHADRIFELDFRPPYALRLFSLSPTLSAKPDFANRTFTLSACSWRQRIDVHASGLPETFFPLSAPFPEGMKDNALVQSFRAEISVRVYEWRWGSRWWDIRGWWAGQGGGDPDVGHWKLSEETVFQDGSLEFGGGYYDFAGEERK